MGKKTILVALLGVLMVAVSMPQTATHAQQEKRKIYISGISVEGAPASMAREIRNIIEVTLYEYGSQYRVITDDDIKVMYKKAEQLMAGGCTAESCQQQIADAIDADEILYGELTVQGDTGIFKGKNLVRDRKSLQIDVKSVVQYQFAMAQKEYYIKEIAKKLIDSKYTIVAAKGREEIAPLALAPISVKEITAIQFVTSDEGVNRITAALKEEIEEGDALYAKNKYEKAIAVYQAVLDKIATKLTADKQMKVQDIRQQVAQRRDSSYGKLYAQRVYEVDEAFNKAATVEALQKVAGRYGALADEVERIDNSRWGEGKQATLEGIQYRYMKAYEKASQQQFSGYNFAGAYESMKQAYTMAVRSAGSKRDEYVNDYAVKLMAIITTGQGYTSNRVQAYLDIAQYYNYKDDSKNAKKTIQQAYEMLTAHRQYMTKETVRQYNEAVQVIGGTVINEADYFHGKAGIAVVAMKLQGKDTKPVIAGLSEDIVAKNIISMGDAIVSVNGKPVNAVDDIEHELNSYAYGADIVIQIEPVISHHVVIKNKSIGINNIDCSKQAAVATLTGHNDLVNSVAYSPDGRYIVSGSRDNTIKVWDARTYKEVETLRGHNRWVYSVAYSPDGRYIVSGSEDATIKVWDARTYKEVATLRGHDGFVQSVVYSPDGRYIVSGSWDKTIKVWDATTYKELATLIGHKDVVLSVVYSPDGKYIVSGSWDDSIKVWDAQTYTGVATLRGHNGNVQSVAYSPDGRYIVSGSNDTTIKVWDARTYKEVATLTGHDNSVLSVAYSPDGKYIVSGSWDDSIKVWDAQTYTGVATLSENYGHVYSVAYSPDGKYIVSGNLDTTVRIWDATIARTACNLANYKRLYHAVVQKGNVAEKEIYYKAKCYNSITIKNAHNDSVESVTYSPDGRYIVSGSADRAIKVWDATTYEEVATLRGHDGFVQSVVYSPDGRYIVSGSQDKTIKVWDTRTYKEVATLTGHTQLVLSVAYSPDGKYIVSGSLDHTIKVWDAKTYKEVATLSGHDGVVQSVVYSPDGRYIVSGSWDKTIKVWDAQTYTAVATLRGHNDNVNSVAYSPDGRYIVSGSRDNTIKVWDARTYKEVATLTGHNDDVASVAYSPDGRYIVSGSSDTTIKVWDARTYKEVATLRGHDGFVQSVVYSPDGRYIVSGGFITIKVWDMQVILPKVF